MCAGGRWQHFYQEAFEEPDGFGGVNQISTNQLFLENLPDERSLSSLVDQEIDADKILKTLAALLLSQEHTDDVKLRLAGYLLREIAVQRDSNISSASRNVKDVRDFAPDINQVWEGVKKHIKTANEDEVIQDKKLKVLYGNCNGQSVEEIMRENKLDRVFVEKVRLEIRDLAHIEIEKINAAKKPTTQQDNASDQRSLANDTVN